MMKVNHLREIIEQAGLDVSVESLALDQFEDFHGPD
jgi:hypothetical protein